jgi:cell division protein ZapB
MDVDLKALEEKLSQLVALCRTLGAENAGLKQELAQAQDDAEQLKSQITQASIRLEALIGKLPQDIAG